MMRTSCEADEGSAPEFEHRKAGPCGAAASGRERCCGDFAGGRAAGGRRLQAGHKRVHGPKGGPGARGGRCIQRGSDAARLLADSRAGSLPSAALLSAALPAAWSPHNPLRHPADAMTLSQAAPAVVFPKEHVPTEPQYILPCLKTLHREWRGERAAGTPLCLNRRPDSTPTSFVGGCAGLEGPDMPPREAGPRRAA